MQYRVDHSDDLQDTKAQHKLPMIVSSPRLFAVRYSGVLISDPNANSCHDFLRFRIFTSPKKRTGTLDLGKTIF